MKRSLQEWANFLNMYVAITSIGDVLAFPEKPCLKGSFNTKSNKVDVGWEMADTQSTVSIDSKTVDLSKFEVIDVGSFYNIPYYIGWDSSLTSPNED